jgi:hypothetical protein
VKAAQAAAVPWQATATLPMAGGPLDVTC